MVVLMIIIIIYTIIKKKKSQSRSRVFAKSMAPRSRGGKTKEMAIGIVRTVDVY